MREKRVFAANKFCSNRLTETILISRFVIGFNIQLRRFYNDLKVNVPDPFQSLAHVLYLNLKYETRKSECAQRQVYTSSNMPIRKLH